MRILLSLSLGLLLFFYLAELLGQIYKVFNYALAGLVLFLSGILVGFFAGGILPGLNVLLAYFLIGAGLGLSIHHLLSRRFFLFENKEREFVLKHEGVFVRILEIFPGALTWLALTSPIWLSFTMPYAVAYLILIADRKMESVKKQNWLKLLQSDFPHIWEKYYHLILVPTYKEPSYILASTFNGILNSSIPKDKIFLAVGFEEKDDQEKIKETSSYLQKNLQGKIAGVFTTIHPYGLEGEVAGQGSNKNWMIKNALKELSKRGIKKDSCFVTTIDADFVLHPEFLAGSLHKYLSQPIKERDKRSFTGVFFYHNNYWQPPSPISLMATGTSFWQMAEMAGSDKYINYSSMSISLKSLLEIGLWIPDKVNDDSGFYWKAYYHFNGDYKVIPHFLPISADAVQDTTLLLVGT